LDKNFTSTAQTNVDLYVPLLEIQFGDGQFSSTFKRPSLKGSDTYIFFSPMGKFTPDLEGVNDPKGVRSPFIESVLVTVLPIYLLVNQ
jgi:hypothetical protein